MSSEEWDYVVPAEFDYFKPDFDDNDGDDEWDDEDDDE